MEQTPTWQARSCSVGIKEVRSRVQKVSALTYKSRAKWKTLWGIYSAIYGEVNVSVEKCVEIKGDYVEKWQSCFISVTLKSWSGRKLLDPATYRTSWNQNVWFQSSAAKQIRTALFCDITQRVLAIYYRRFGTTYRSHLKWHLKMVQISCPETSAINFHYSLRNIPEQQSYQQQCSLPPSQVCNLFVN